MKKEDYLEWFDKRALRREKKKRKRMKVSGKKVFEILKIKRKEK